MVLKILSLATALVTLDVYQQSQLHSANPIFLFISSNLAVNIALVILAATAVAASFLKRFKYKELYALCAGLAIALCAWGLAGIAFSSLDYWFVSVFMPLDYVLILLFGIILGANALGHQHSRRRLFGPLNLRLSKPSMSLGKLAFSKLISLVAIPEQQKS